MPGAARHTLHKLKVSACNLRFMAKRGGGGVVGGTEAGRREGGPAQGLAPGAHALMTGGAAEVSFHPGLHICSYSLLEGSSPLSPPSSPPLSRTLRVHACVCFS